MDIKAEKASADEIEAVTPNMNDSAEIKRLAKLAVKPKNPSAAVALARLARRISVLDPDSRNKYASLLKAVKEVVSPSPNAQLKLVQVLVDMPFAEWKRRHLLELTRRADEAEMEVVMMKCTDGRVPAPTRQAKKHKPPVAAASPCDALRQTADEVHLEISATLGKAVEQRTLIASEEGAGANAIGGKYDPTRYTKLRAAALLAQGDIDTARSALKAPVAAPVTARKDAVIMLNATDVSNADKDWVRNQVLDALPASAATLPEFVVVIDKGVSP